MSFYFVFSIGILAQLLFSARLVVQWIVSERAHKVSSPALFWQLSMVGSILLCLYGWLRNDFAIIMGQFVSYYIYIWNINSKGLWQRLPIVVRYGIITLPFVAVGWFLLNFHDTFIRLFGQKHITFWLIVFGVVGQSIFTLRFVYQWWYSRKVGESVLPVLFWIISLVGSALIIFYAILRSDMVLLLGQSAGFVVYGRNIMIGYKHRLKLKKGFPLVL